MGSTDTSTVSMGVSVHTQDPEVLKTMIWTHSGQEIPQNAQLEGAQVGCKSQQPLESEILEVEKRDNI